MKSGTTIGGVILTAGLAVGLATGISAIHLSAQASTSQAAHVAAAPPPERINMTIVPDALLGSNKRTHDAFIPAYLTAQVGQQVTVTVYNLDTSPHSFTAPALHLNVIVPGAKAQGLVATNTFSFTVNKKGVYQWRCILPCDNGGANAWAMTHNGYMAGTITIE
jgi:plastocyanin